MVEYDPYLGLTEDERGVVSRLNEAGLLSHFIQVDRDVQQVITLGRHIETGEVFVQRRRPFTDMEQRPFPTGLGFLHAPEQPS
jgi:hypothetical protein